VLQRNNKDIIVTKFPWSMGPRNGVHDLGEFFEVRDENIPMLLEWGHARGSRNTVFDLVSCNYENLSK
jgi:hypothetical protein